MKDIIMLVIQLSLIFCLSAGIVIKLKPFSISFESLAIGIGVLLIIFAIACFYYQGYNSGRMKGYEKGCEDLVNIEVV